MKEMQLFENGDFLLSYKKELHKCSFNELEAIICEKPYLELYINNRMFLLKLSLKVIANILPPTFIQISRKVFINVLFFKSFFLKNSIHQIQTINKTFEVSKRRYKAVREAILQHYSSG